MTTIKKTILALGLAVSLIAGSAAYAETAPKQEAAAPSKQEFIASMGEKVLTILQDKKKTFEKKQAALRAMFTETVDTDWIAKFVLGKAWKEAN